VAEIQDSEFLRILRENPLVPQDEVRSAQETQRDELDRQGSCRSLFAILRDKGLIDERVARTAAPAGDRPGDVTPHTPTVVLTHSDNTPVPGRPSSSSSISKIRSSRPLPPEVEAARAVPKNVLGPYVLVREVGKGGMGRVYRAWDENVGRYVAVKVIDTEDVSDRERFVREAQIAGRLHHPSIATVFQAGEQGTRGYIAMQFIEGGPIDGHKMPLLATLGLIRDAARALSYAHEQGVIHRDVKPGNLMVDGKGHVYLTDFGLAKEVVGDAGTQLSITGTTFGTPQYMSPEQARGEHRKMDGRCDVYSLGATLYALLARRPPFTTTNLATLLLEVLDKTPPPLSRFNREISPELQMAVERAMAKDAARRYPTMAAFAEALDGLIRSGRYAGRYGLARSLARRWVPRLLAAGLLGAALWFGVPAVVALRKPPPADPSPAEYAEAASALRLIEGRDLSPALRREQVDAQVLPPLRRVLDRKPDDLRSLALRLRADYARGDSDAVDRGLAALGPKRGEDYRLLLIPALRTLEKALGAPIPLAAFEGPGFEWEAPPAPLDAGSGELAKAKVEADQRQDYEEDRPLLEGLSALSLGQYAQAAELLAKNKLPVVQAARWRAVYLARGFREILESPETADRDERFGASFALAEGSPERLEKLLPSAGSRAPSVHAALARLEDAPGLEGHVAEGLKGAGPERQAALWSAILRRRALSGADPEEAWRQALKDAGERPSTGQGKLAAIELRIGLGSRLLRTKEGDGRPVLEEAAARAEALLKESPKWGAPLLLAAQARLRLGKLEEAQADLTNLPEGLKGSTRARLTRAALELAAAERERRGGGAYLGAAQQAERAALAAPRGSGEAQALLGGALLLEAQHASESGQDEAGAVDKAWEALTRALSADPGYVQAHYDRARANFLRAELARRRSAGDGRAQGEEALEDADAALKGWPGFAAARNLRGIVNFSLGRDAEAVADWRALIRADAAWDTPEVRSWIQRAEGRLPK
jgi:hypothetical protein